MLPSFDGLLDRQSLIAAVDVLVKLGFAAVLGGLIGYERELHGRPAGVRTHMLMCLGVTLVCEVSKAFSTIGDPSRIASNIVTGVGFLGAGSILRMGVEIRGLTTAASIWAAAAIGMSVSVGHSFYVVAVVSTLLVLITLSVVDRIERRFVPDAHPRELLVTAAGRECIGELVDRLEASGLRVSGLELERGAGTLVLRVRVEGAKDGAVQTAMRVEGVSAANWAD